MSVFQKVVLRGRSPAHPWRYLPGDGRVIDSVRDIRELVVVAVPLVATEKVTEQVSKNPSFKETGRLPGPPYGVLQIATDKSSAWLSTSDHAALFAFAALANETILCQLERIMDYNEQK